MVEAKAESNNALSFLEEHPRTDKLTLKKRKREAVVRVSGSRLPDAKLLDDDDVEDEKGRDELREKFAAAVLTMFFPWRDSSCIFDDEDDGSWWRAYKRHLDLGSFSATATTILSNMQNYHERAIREAEGVNAKVDSEEAVNAEEASDAKQDEEAAAESEQGAESFDAAPADEVKGLPSLGDEYAFFKGEHMQTAPVSSQEFGEALTGHRTLVEGDAKQVRRI